LSGCSDELRRVLVQVEKSPQRTHRSDHGRNGHWKKLIARAITSVKARRAGIHQRELRVDPTSLIASELCRP